MQVTRSDNAGPGKDIWWPGWMMGGKDILLEKKKTYDTMLQSNFVLSDFFF